MNKPMKYKNEGKASKNGKTIYWYWHEYLGPEFTRPDGSPLARWPSQRHWVWPHFTRWLKRWEKRKELRDRARATS